MARDLLAGRTNNAPAPAADPRDLLANRPDPAQARYDAALANIRQTQFPQMSDAQFADYAAHTFSPDLNALSSNGSTFGLADEISSGLGALGSQVRSAVGGGGQGFGDAYNTYQELENARLNLARQKTGGLGTAVELGTGLATMGPERAVVEALAASGGRRAAATVAQPLLNTVLKSGATGAGMGGVSGFTNAEGGLGERALGAAGGAAFGLGLGVAIPTVARSASAVVDALLQTAAGKQAAARIGISPEGAKFLQSHLAADNSLGPVGQAQMAAAGHEATLADAGPAARSVLDYAIQKSGRAGTVARQAIGDRVSRDAMAVNDALDNAFGPPTLGRETTKAAIRTTTAPARGNAYDTAYAQPIDYSSPDGQQIEQLLQRVPKEAYDLADKLMHAKGVKSAQIMAQIANDGSVTFKTMPDVRQLDYITRALNQEAKHGIGQGSMGGNTDYGSTLSDLSGEIRDTLRVHVPEYGDALATGQDAIQRTQAVQNGYELLRPSTTVEDVRGWSHNMKPAQRADAAQGIRSHLADVISNVTRTITDGDVPAREALKTLRDLSSTASRDKVAMVIGQNEADTLFAELDRATKSFELRASVADNSNTFRRQSMDQHFNAMNDTIVHTARKGEPLNATKRTIQAVTGATPEAEQAAKDAILQEVTRALTARGPAALRTARALSKLGNRQASSDAVRAAILRAGNLSTPIAVVGGPAAYQAWQRSRQQ